MTGDLLYVRMRGKHMFAVCFVRINTSRSAECTVVFGETKPTLFIETHPHVPTCPTCVFFCGCLDYIREIIRHKMSVHRGSVFRERRVTRGSGHPDNMVNYVVKVAPGTSSRGGCIAKVLVLSGVVLRGVVGVKHDGCSQLVLEPFGVKLHRRQLRHRP